MEFNYKLANGIWEYLLEPFHCSNSRELSNHFNVNEEVMKFHLLKMYELKTGCFSCTTRASGEIRLDNKSNKDYVKDFLSKGGFESEIDYDELGDSIISFLKRENKTDNFNGLDIQNAFGISRDAFWRAINLIPNNKIEIDTPDSFDLKYTSIRLLPDAYTKRKVEQNVPVTTNTINIHGNVSKSNIGQSSNRLTQETNNNNNNEQNANPSPKPKINWFDRTIAVIGIIIGLASIVISYYGCRG